MSRHPFTIRDEEARQRALFLIASLDLKRIWQVTVEPYRKQRSLSQNGLYWRWVEIISNDTGNDVDAIHDYLKGKFLTPKEMEIAGEKFMCRSTRKLDTKTMSEYMDRCYSWAGSDLGIFLPIPEEMHLPKEPGVAFLDDKIEALIEPKA